MKNYYQLSEESEIWKDIKDYEGLYMVSNLGRIKSLKRKANTGRGGWRIWEERILKQGTGTSGEKTIVLYSSNSENKKRSRLVHRLVIEAFIPNPENKPTVNHIDGNRKNNCLSNLEWATWSENNKHAYLTGLNNPSKNLPKHNRPVDMLDLEGNILMSFNSITEASLYIGKSLSPIYGVCAGYPKHHTAHGYKWKFQNIPNQDVMPEL